MARLLVIPGYSTDEHSVFLVGKVSKSLEEYNLELSFYFEYITDNGNEIS